AKREEHSYDFGAVKNIPLLNKKGPGEVGGGAQAVCNPDSRDLYGREVQGGINAEAAMEKGKKQIPLLTKEGSGEVDGGSHKPNRKSKTVLVHRKGATRAFPKGHSALPPELREVGQPVLIPGSMGTNSYV